MSALEARYRSALRWYPRDWRAAHGDAAVGVLLDAADAEGRDQPAPGDLANLVVHGVAAHIDRIVGMRVRDAVAASALATGVGYSLALFVITSWAPFVSGHLSVEYHPSNFSPYLDLGPILTALWMVALGCALGRGGRLSAASLVVLLATLICIEIAHGVGLNRSISQFSLLFQVALTLLSSIGRPQHRGRLAASAAVWAGVFLGIAAANDQLRQQATLWLWALGPANAAGLTIALTLAAIIAAGAMNLHMRDLGMTISISALPWMLMWSVELAADPMNYFEWPFPIEATALVGACAVAVVWCHRRSLRRERIGIRSPAQVSPTPRS